MRQNVGIFLPRDNFLDWKRGRIVSNKCREKERKRCFTQRKGVKLTTKLLVGRRPLEVHRDPGAVVLAVRELDEVPPPSHLEPVAAVEARYASSRVVPVATTNGRPADLDAVLRHEGLDLGPAKGLRVGVDVAIETGDENPLGAELAGAAGEDVVVAAVGAAIASDGRAVRCTSRAAVRGPSSVGGRVGRPGR